MLRMFSSLTGLQQKRNTTLEFKLHEKGNTIELVSVY